MIVELARQFVPAADEVGFLQSRKGPECELFRKVAEQGHYAGRSKPTATRQGIYATAPSGRLLASVNTTDPRRMEAMLRRAIGQWEKMPREKRLLSRAPDPEAAAPHRPERRYPTGGLILRVHSRDVAREKKPSGWRSEAWNRDMAWFRKEEARRFLPSDAAPGSRHSIPESLVRRLVRCHLVDNVRGQTRAFPKSAIKRAELATRITAVEEGIVSLRLEGSTRAVERGTWPVGGYRDMHDPRAQERGIEVKLFGRARFDLQAQRFVVFELVAIGKRWGGTQYNGRRDDLPAAPIGFAFTLAGQTAADRVAPAFWWAYRNKGPGPEKGGQPDEQVAPIRSETGGGDQAESGQVVVGARRPPVNIPTSAARKSAPKTRRKAALKTMELSLATESFGWVFTTISGVISSVASTDGSIPRAV